jgi:hypothetical protein
VGNEWGQIDIASHRVLDHAGSCVRPLTPPKADPFQTRPVTSWNGRVEISSPAPATPITID